MPAAVDANNPVCRTRMEQQYQGLATLCNHNMQQPAVMQNGRLQGNCKRQTYGQLHMTDGKADAMGRWKIAAKRNDKGSYKRQAGK